MDKKQEKGFDFAKETTIQLLTLATAILTLSIAFLEKFPQQPTCLQKLSLSLSWLSFLVSVCGGIWTLMALTGTLEEEGEQCSIWGSNVTIPSMLQVITFALGILFAVLFGFATVWK